MKFHTDNTYGTQAGAPRRVRRERARLPIEEGLLQRVGRAHHDEEDLVGPHDARARTSQQEEEGKTRRHFSPLELFREDNVDYNSIRNIAATNERIRSPFPFAFAFAESFHRCERQRTPRLP